MRKGIWASGLLMALGLAAPAAAQTKDPASFFTGVRPTDIVYKPIDPNHSVVPIPQQNGDSYTLRRILSKVIPGLSPTPPTTGMLIPAPPIVNGKLQAIGPMPKAAGGLQAVAPPPTK